MCLAKTVYTGGEGRPPGFATTFMCQPIASCRIAHAKTDLPMSRAGARSQCPGHFKDDEDDHYTCRLANRHSQKTPICHLYIYSRAFSSVSSITSLSIVLPADPPEYWPNPVEGVPAAILSSVVVDHSVSVGRVLVGVVTRLRRFEGYRGSPLFVET